MRVIKLLTYCFLCLSLYSCKVDARKVIVQPYELCHDSGSKVWLLKHQIINGKEARPEQRSDRWTITFYNDRTFVFNTLKNFGNYSMFQGRFSFSEDAKQMFFHWNNGETYTYNLIAADHSCLKFNIEKDGELIEYEYTTIDKRVMNYDAVKEKRYEESVYY